MSVDLANGKTKADAPRLLTLMLGALLLARGGSMPMRAAIEVAWAVQTGSRSALRTVVAALQPLIDDGVVVRHDEMLYAPVMADLAAWVADGYEFREDVGLITNPVVPPPPVPAQRAAGSAAPAA